MKKEWLYVLTGVVALTSCTTVNQKQVDNKPKVEYKLPEYSAKIEMDNLIKERDKKEVNRLEQVLLGEFKVSNLDYMYKGEEIYANVEINPYISFVKLFYKPSENSENYLYAEIRDNNTGNTKDILLKKNIKVIDRPELFGIQNYNELKVPKDNGRINYEISTLDSSFDDFDYSDRLSPNNYKDIDDYAGIKNDVVIKQSVNGAEPIFFKGTVKFGKSIEDIKDYNLLLSNLETTPIKFKGDTDTTVLGGFDEEYVDKLTNFYKNSPSEGKIEFVTEILDKEKDTVGFHNISRKVIFNDKVIFEKRDRAFVSFPGITLAVIDTSFFDLSDEVEKRTYRATPKSNDIVTDFIKQIKEDKNTPDDLKQASLKTALQGLTRTHGANVIGSMIDEAVGGNRLYINGIYLDLLLKMGASGKLVPTIATDYKALNQAILFYVGLNLSSKYVTSASVDGYNIPIKAKIDEAKKEFDKIMTPLYMETAFDNNYEDTPEKVEKFKEAYKKLLKIAPELYSMSEDSKLALTNLHFATISAGDSGDKISVAEALKNLSGVLAQDKSIKVVNMSYGNDQNVEDYIKLKNMTDAEKEAGAKAYNTNIKFRTAILSWLKNYDKQLETYYRNSADGLSLTIGSVYKYFEARKEITKEDYDKLVQIKLAGLGDMAKTTPELAATNYDVLFVRAQGNTYNAAEVNLTDFDENGNKIVYKDPNYKYNNNLSSIPTLLNELEKEKAKKEGKEYKYNYNYRKNILGVVGLSSTLLPTGAEATERYFAEKDWALFTISINLKKMKQYGIGDSEHLDELIKKINDFNENPEAYNDEYKKEIMDRYHQIVDEAYKHTSPDDKTSLFSFSRAGAAKLWTVSSDGTYFYTKELTEEEKKYNEITDDVLTNHGDDKYGYNINSGSSFAAPRVSAIAGIIQSRYPWMTAHQIKQSIVTGAVDDAIIKITDDKITIEGNYGVDENYGWGFVTNTTGVLGPRRFVKALTHEVGEENYIANIPYGVAKFYRDIDGGFNKVYYSLSNKQISENEAKALELTKKYSNEELSNSNFLDDKEELKNKLNQTGISYTAINSLRDRIDSYIDSLPFEEKELFMDAGLIKDGVGTLILGGENSYKEPTIVKQGTLVVGGSMESDIYVNKDTKLKIDASIMETVKVSPGVINSNIINEGTLYSYSTKDKIEGTYIPKNDSKTLIAGNATLSINKLDLSNIDHFNIDVFAKKGMLILQTKDFWTDTVTDKESQDLLIVKNIENKDFAKIKLGELNVSTSYKIKIAKTEENSKLGLKITLLRRYDTPVVVKDINTAIKTLSLETGNESILEEANTINLLSEEESEKLNGDLLTDSMSLGFDILNIKNNSLKRALNHSKVGTYQTFGEALSNIRLRKYKNSEKMSTINGFVAGISYKTKMDTFGIALNYTNSRLKDIAIKEDSKELKGDVVTNSLGLDIINNINYQGVYLKSILGFTYISKDLSRELILNGASNVKSSDFLFNFNNELGYTYEHSINKDNKFSITPYLGVNLTSYIKGKFDENQDFGYKGKEEHKFMTDFTVGLKLGGKTKIVDLELYVDYNKYINPNLKSSATLSKYNFTRNIEGISLEEYKFGTINFGLNTVFNINEIFKLNMGINSKNIKDNTVYLGAKFEF